MTQDQHIRARLHHVGLSQRLRIESFIAYFNATMAKPFRWTMKGKPLVA